MNAPSPALSQRLLSAACYLGLAPLIRRGRAPADTPFLQHHYQQAMAVVFCACLLVALDACCDFALGAFFILFPKTGDYLMAHWGWLGAYVDFIPWVVLLALAGLWLVPLTLALAGSAWPMRGLRALSRRAWVVRWTFRANLLFWLLLPGLLLFGLYTSSLTSRIRPGAAVYFLYDEGIPVPRWGYAMGLCRIARQAERNWGPHCTVLDRLTRDTLQTALASGKVIILATHGDSGYAGTYDSPQNLLVGPPPLGATDALGHGHFLQTTILPYEWESWKRLREGKWDRWENLPVGNQVQLVYLFACNGGKKAAEWEQHLSPARVISYNRTSAVWDHAWWFAVTGPTQLARLR